MAGVAVAIVVAIGVITAVGVSGSGAASPDRTALVGEARQAKLTVDLPAAYADRIYGAPIARGRPIVVIDAGHGGRDPGARSVSGEVAEKELTLALARELRDDLVKRGRVRVAMTRDDDRYLTLDDRAAVARRLDAAMFVSLHIDSAPNPLARGASVYSLSDVASDAEAAHLAAAENGAGIGGREGRLGRGDALGSRDALADERVGRPRGAAGEQIGRPVRASARPASLRRFLCPQERRHARGPVRGRLSQQRR